MQWLCYRVPLIFYKDLNILIIGVSIIKRSLFLWQFGGFAFTSFAGTLVHFLYDFANESKFVAIFSSVNESIFEHIKLLYFPMVAYAIFESLFIARDYYNYWSSKLVGIVSGIILIPVLYYTYTGVLGVSADWVNIAIFFIAAAATYVIEYSQIKKNNLCYLPQGVCFILICTIGAFVVYLTFNPIRIPLFQDPVNGTYGITST